MRAIKVLVIGDQEVTLLGCKYIFDNLEFEGRRYDTEIAIGYEQGRKKLMAKSKRYDIILIDLRLFPIDKEDIKTGENLGILARKRTPGAMLVYVSGLGGIFGMNELSKSVDPDGYIVRSDISKRTIEQMVEAVITGPFYISNTALNALRMNMASRFSPDRHDLMILHQLSIGTRTKDIRKHTGMATTTVEMRKRAMKRHFGVESENDFRLLEEAKKRGFID